MIPATLRSMSLDASGDRATARYSQGARKLNQMEKRVAGHPSPQRPIIQRLYDVKHLKNHPAESASLMVIIDALVSYARRASPRPR